MTKKAIVTGVNGQDGSYLAELLLGKEYQVIGVVRYSSCSENSRNERIADIKKNSNFHLEYCDVTDFSTVNSLVLKHQPDEIYNLAAQSHVGVSYKNPVSTTNINIMGPLNFLESIRVNNSDIRFYQASTSEMFGVNEKCPQNEETPMLPISPYAAAKLFAHNLVKIYRDSYGIYACSGILFNHESERRGEEFVTRKITKAAARIKLGKQSKLHLGNLEAYRDWGHAADYVEAMRLMLQQEQPDDYVISTGETHTVKEFLHLVFDYAGLKVEDHLVIDPEFFRPSEVPKLWGDFTKAKQKLKWQPKIKFEELAIRMYESDLKLEKMGNDK